MTQANLELLIFLLQPPKSQGFSYRSHRSFFSFSLKLEPELTDRVTAKNVADPGIKPRYC